MASLKLCVLALALILMTATVNSDFSTSLNKFNGHFYQQSLKQTKDANSIVSAISAEIALAMLLEGASGKTEIEIQNALISNDKKSNTQYFKKLIEDLGKVENVNLKIANAIFGALPASRRLDSIQPTYKAIVRDSFKSEIRLVDFSKNVEAAALINKWVDDQTNNHIKNFISSDSLDSSTKAVLINAIYFKGTWLKPFHVFSTYKRKFTRSDGSTLDIDMMYQQDDFLYEKSSELNSQILVLPYKNEDTRLVIILPDKKDGLSELEKKLENGINQYLQNLVTCDVHVTLPKFKIETSLDVKEISQKLGINQLFTTKANLDGIFFEHGVYITDAFQKAFIEVNERGSEAAAATGFYAVVESLLINQHSAYFVADHGFHFAIQYKKDTMFSGSFRSG